MNFHVKGEVAGTLLLKSDGPKLLVDLSPETAGSSSAPGFRYPKRVCFTIRCGKLIKRFQRDISAGDVIEAHGAFEQSGYVPQGNTHVDTTFELRSFQRVAAKLPDLAYAGRSYQVGAPALLN